MFTPLLACLSVEALNASYQVAYYSVTFAAVAVIAASIIEWNRGKFSWLAIYVALLVLHPAWRLAYGEILHGWRAMSSDCGYGNRFLAVGLLSATLSVLFILVLRPEFSKRLFLVILTAVCWLVHLGTFLFLHLINLPFWLPAKLSATTFAQEAIVAIDFGQARLSRFTVILTVLCAALYFPWRQLRQWRRGGKGVKAYY